MRKEFSQRKIQDQNSGESGYSDEHDEDEDDKITKAERFDKNLLMFDRTASPTFTERRRSESPMPQDFTSLCIFARAQSEPPPNFERSFNREIEVHDLVTDPLPCEEAATQSQHEGNSQEEALIVQSPPVIHDYDSKNPPQIKTNLRKIKKKKKGNGGKAESAEEMYFRLMATMNGENSTTSTSTIDDDELDLENIEEIPLDPVPEIQFEEVQSEDDFVHVDIPEQMSYETEVVKGLTQSDIPVIPPEEPSTSSGALSTTEQDFLQRREARLARLEAEAKEFYEKMARDKAKRLELNNKLSNVHQNFLDREKRRTQLEENDSSSDDDDNNTENVDEQKTNQNDDGKS